jgi:hypothetical protein
MQQQLAEFSKTLIQMPVAALITLVVLASFGLSAFSIYTIAKIAKSRRNGN